MENYIETQSFDKKDNWKTKAMNGHQQENDGEVEDKSWFISNDLSEGLVLFSSEEGKRIFFECAQAGYLGSYFELSQNFLTSIEPRFGCGLATLTMCLNTFCEDPCRVWRDIYRYYTQTMLEHCVPYGIIAGNGIVFQQFACMVECNYLKVAQVCHLKPTASMDEFRSLCKKVTAACCDEILVVCYHRIGLDQVGTGHFSPIGGYHPGKDLVLVFDISRYKYPLHWVPLKRLWRAMALDDDVTGNPRGYYVLRKRSGLEKPALLFKTVSPEDSPTFHKGWLRIFKHALVPWHEWMKSLDVSSFKNGAILQEAIRYLLLRMMSLKCTGISHLDGIHVRLEFVNPDSLSELDCLVCKVRETIEECTLWEHIRKEIMEQLRKQQQSTCPCWRMLINDVSEEKEPESPVICCRVKIQPSSCHLRRFNLAHYITVVLLSWPYEFEGKNNHKITTTGICSAMNDIVSTELSNMNEELKDEVVNVRNRFLKTHRAT